MPLRTMRDDDPSINLAPMIDIVFLLIIFFMVGSHFTEQQTQERDMAVRVPQVAQHATQTTPPKKRMIHVLGNGSVRLDGSPVSLVQLEQELRAEHSTGGASGVVLRGDSQSSYQAVAEVIAICRKAGVQDLNLAVRMAQAEQK